MINSLIKIFIKDWENTSDLRVRNSYGKFASIVGIISNTILFLIKIIIGVLFNSISITADAINNLSDSGSSLVTLIGFKLSSKPADAQHPFGHARIEYLSGLSVSFIIFFMGFQLITSSIDKIINPMETEFSYIVVVALVISILIKLWQALFYKGIAKRINSTTLIANATDSRNDTISTTSVLIASIISYYTKINLDGIMGVIIGIIIILSGIDLIKETASPLIGMGPSKELVDSIANKILSYNGILGFHDLAVHSYGEGRIFASVHCEVDANQDIMVSHDIIDNIERDFLKDDNINLVIHLDPVVTNDERINKLKTHVEEIIHEISLDISLHDFRVVFGITHTNLIFDIVVPFNYDILDNEVISIISNRIQDIDETYRAVITIDHSYIEE